MLTLVSKINATYTDISGFCNLSSFYWEDLIKITAEIQDPNDENAENFKLGIFELKENIQDKEKKAQELVNKLAAFRTDLESDNRNLQTIVADADRIYAGNEGEIQTTRKNIDAISSAIDKDIGIITISAVTLAGGDRYDRRGSYRNCRHSRSCSKINCDGCFYHINRRRDGNSRQY